MKPHKPADGLHSLYILIYVQKHVLHTQTLIYKEQIVDWWFNGPSVRFQHHYNNDNKQEMISQKEYYKPNQRRIRMVALCFGWVLIRLFFCGWASHHV